MLLEIIKASFKFVFCNISFSKWIVINEKFFYSYLLLLHLKKFAYFSYTAFLILVITLSSGTGISVFTSSRAA